MRQLLLLTLTLFCSVTLTAQPTFYIQNGNSIAKVENRNPDQVKAKEWKVRLYRKGAPRSGNSYWGTINGNSAKEVMSKLKVDQDFELRFNAFIGKGQVQNNVLTNFNPLGPIAVVEDDESKDEESAEEESTSKKNLNDLSVLNEDAKQLLEDYNDVKKKLDIILKGKPVTAFDNVGNVFKEYTSNLKNAFKQVDLLRNMLSKNLNADITKIIENFQSSYSDVTDNKKIIKYSLEENDSDNNLPNTKNTSSSAYTLMPNVPEKYRNVVSRIIAGGADLTSLRNSLPKELTQ